MEFIEVTVENIDKEHICCAISDKKGETCVSSKKNWMKERFKDGLRFIKLNERGKVFIEFIPADKAFAPIDADGYMFINCFWVSGKYKGQGLSNKLLEICVHESKKLGFKGLVALSSTKKMPFLSDPKYLKYKGFKVADVAEPYFELLYLPFEVNDTKIPSFTDRAKLGTIDEKGVVVYYTNQCPHTSKYVPIIEEVAKTSGIMFTSHKIESSEEAKKAPCPFTTYSVFIDGEFITNEILTDKKFIKLIEERK